MNYFELFKQMARQALVARLSYTNLDGRWLCVIKTEDGEFLAMRESPELAIGEVYSKMAEVVRI